MFLKKKASAKQNESQKTFILFCRAAAYLCILLLQKKSNQQ